MSNIFDRNLSVENKAFDNTVKVCDITQKPFMLYGNCVEAESVFSRMPEAIACKISEGVLDRAKRCAGVRLRFKTNSKQLGIRVKFSKTVQFPAQSAISTKGFDVYVGGKYISSLFSQNINTSSFEDIIDLGNCEEKDIIIYFPYNAVIENIGLALDNEAFVVEGNDYEIRNPIVFYGSSITQGFCVSRPGNTFTAMLSRMLNFDYINLGFSGVCRGEEDMAEYLGSLNKSVFICGYDHNEQCLNDLKERHLPFYIKFREKDSNSPILFVSSPNSICKGEMMYPRMNVVRETYEYAKSIGDKNVYFINGQTIYPDKLRFDCSADAIHPNDLGSYMISTKIYYTLKKILYK